MSDIPRRNSTAALFKKIRGRIGGRGAFLLVARVAHACYGGSRSAGVSMEVGRSMNRALCEFSLESRTAELRAMGCQCELRTYLICSDGLAMRLFSGTAC